MKLKVDPTKCNAYGECVTIAPELFEQDEWGYATALNSGEVPPGLEDKASEAVKACPAKAILDEG